MADQTSDVDPTSYAEALRIFVGAAYAVSTEINPRGHNWSEAYLDQALSIARDVLSGRPQTEAAERAGVIAVEQDNAERGE